MNSSLRNRFTASVATRCWHGQSTPPMPLVRSRLSLCCHRGLQAFRTGWMAPLSPFRNINSAPEMPCLQRAMPLGTLDGVAVIMFADTPLVTAESIAAMVQAIDNGASLAVAGFEAADPLAMVASFVMIQVASPALSRNAMRLTRSGDPPLQRRNNGRDGQFCCLNCLGRSRTITPTRNITSPTSLDWRQRPGIA